MTEPSLAYVPKIEGLQPSLDRQVDNYINAAHPDFFVSRNQIDAIGTVGVLSGIVAAVAFVDVANENLSTSLPDHAQSKMESATNDMREDLSTNPDIISVCQTQDDNGECVVNEAYEMRSQEGVVRYVTDQLPATGVKGDELQILLTGLPSEPNGDRTAAFDAEMIAGLEGATEAYVEQLPERPLNTALPQSAEALVLGSSLAIVLVALAKKLGKRLGHQENVIKKASAQLATRAYSQAELSQQEFTVRKAIGFAMNTSRGYILFTGPEVPRPGGEKARKALRSNVQDVIESYARTKQVS